MASPLVHFLEHLIIAVSTDHVGGELLLVLLERQDVALAGVGGLRHLQLALLAVRRAVLHGGRGEVEAAEPLRPHHDRVAVVAAGRDAVHGHLKGRET